MRPIVFYLIITFFAGISAQSQEYLFFDGTDAQTDSLMQNAEEQIDSLRKGNGNLSGMHFIGKNI